MDSLKFLVNFLSKYSKIVGWLLLVFAFILFIYEVAATTASSKRVYRIKILGHILLISVILGVAVAFLIISYS